jgi:hypothetical protein
MKIPVKQNNTNRKNFATVRPNARRRSLRRRGLREAFGG